jgi:hypothetical protein
MRLLQSIDRALQFANMRRIWGSSKLGSERGTSGGEDGGTVAENGGKRRHRDSRGVSAAAGPHRVRVGDWEFGSEREERVREGGEGSDQVDRVCLDLWAGLLVRAN